MLFSVLAALLCYHGILFLVGVLVSAAAIEGALVTLAIVCFVGGYYARSSVLVRRLCGWIGGIAIALVLATWTVLPILQGTGDRWVIISSVIVAVIIFVSSRRRFYGRWFRRDPRTGHLPAPPFGWEWARWVIAIAV